MFKYKVNSCKESTDKKNPMADSQYCYYQSLGKAIVGLERALELRRGKMENVSTNDILEYADIDQEEFENVFKSPEGLLTDVRKEIRDILSDAAIAPEGATREIRLKTVFRYMQKNCPMVRILHLTNDYHIWRMSLRKLVTGVATDWPPVNSPAWEYLYANFCCQFMLILEKWETTDFSDARIDDCVRLADVWLSANGMIGDTVDDLLNDWS